MMSALRFLPLCLLLVTGSGRSWALQNLPQRPVFRGGTDVVTIDVSIRRRNAPVVGLKVSDFEVLDNRVPQRIELLTTAAVPIDVTVVFGRRYLVVGSQVLSDLSRVAAWLRPIDRLRVIAYATDVREVVPMNTVTGREQEGIARAKQWLAGSNQSQFDSGHDPKLRRQSILDALLLALARPPELGRRHLVLAFCAPLDNGSVVSDGSLFQAVAARTDALLHIACGGWPSVGLEPPAEPQSNRAPLQAMSVTGIEYLRRALAGAAAATGGALHEEHNGISLKSLIEDFRQSYLLRYTLTGVPPGGWHTLTVRAPGFPNYEVRARNGYMGR